MSKQLRDFISIIQNAVVSYALSRNKRNEAVRLTYDMSQLTQQKSIPRHRKVDLRRLDGLLISALNDKKNVVTLAREIYQFILSLSTGLISWVPIGSSSLKKGLTHALYNYDPRLAHGLQMKNLNEADFVSQEDPFHDLANASDQTYVHIDEYNALKRRLDDTIESNKRLEEQMLHNRKTLDLVMKQLHIPQETPVPVVVHGNINTSLSLNADT